MATVGTTSAVICKQRRLFYEARRKRKYRPGAGLRTLIINSGGSLFACSLRYLVLWETNCPADAVIAYEPDADCDSLTLLILVQVGTTLLWLQGNFLT